MGERGKVLVNLATGMEDAERVMIAFLVAVAALDDGRDVTLFLTKEAVRLALPGHCRGTACEDCPPLERLFDQFAERGGRMLVCPFCFNGRKLSEDDLVPNAALGGATPMLQWAGNDALVLSY